VLNKQLDQKQLSDEEKAAMIDKIQQEIVALNNEKQELQTKLDNVFKEVEDLKKKH